MRVVMPSGTASAQIIQTQIMPQAMLKQGTVLIFDFGELQQILTTSFSFTSKFMV